MFQMSKASSKNLQQKTNVKPWRLTSQPRPQGGHPPSSGKQGINSCILPFTYHAWSQQYDKIEHNTLQDIPFQGLHKDSTIESSIGWRWALTMRRISKAMIHNIHILSLSTCPFGAYSNFHSTYLLIPLKMQASKRTNSIEHIIIISTHGRVPQLHVWAQLTPSSKHLFPPKGEWCFTPITQDTQHESK